MTVISAVIICCIFLNFILPLQFKIQNFINHDTFELVEQPENADILVINSKWVLRYKQGANNQVLQQKTHYIAREFTQCYRRDYKKIFTRTLKSTIFQVLFTLATYFDIEIEQIDFVSAYLYSELDKIIYVKQPPGFEQDSKINSKWSLI